MIKDDNKASLSLELLAPARNLISGKLAISNGADAVYIGSPRFGARQAATNSWDDIEALSQYAHIFKAKVYVVLNTIFFDSEKEAMQSDLDKAERAGVDAVIIQDPGIFNLRLPKLPIFISTQAHNISPEIVKFWEELGCQRVILGRELSLKEIKNISDHTKVELESFVQGALCVSYSGRCYLSQQMCGRSANRGACTQACRLPYRLVDSAGRLITGEEQSWLCLKDFNASAHLSQLVSTGVTSFKIEGRLKDDVYVANVTAAYRLLLDKIIDQAKGRFRRSSFGKIYLDYVPDLNKSFNRGYTDYNLNGIRDSWLSSGPASLGEEIGMISSIRNNTFLLESSSDLETGNGLVFVRRNKIIGGAYVNQLSPAIKLSSILSLQVGDKVYRNENLSFEKAVLSGSERRLASDWLLSFNSKGVKINVTTETGLRIELIKEGNWETPKDYELATLNLNKQLFKLGGSLFYGRNFNLSGQAKFIPLSIINEWRREAVTALLKAASEDNKVQFDNNIFPTNAPFPVKELDFSFNVANSEAKDFYEKHGAVVKEMAMEIDGVTRNRPLMTTKHCLRQTLGACPRDLNHQTLSEPLFLETKDQRYRLRFDCQRCVMELYQDTGEQK